MYTLLYTMALTGKHELVVCVGSDADPADWRGMCLGSPFAIQVIMYSSKQTILFFFKTVSRLTGWYGVCA